MSCQSHIYRHRLVIPWRPVPIGRDQPAGLRSARDWAQFGRLRLNCRTTARLTLDKPNGFLHTSRPGEEGSPLSFRPKLS